MDTVNFFRKNVTGSRQEDLKELKQELEDRGFSERQVAIILQRRAALLRKAVRTDSPMSYAEAVGRSK